MSTRRGAAAATRVDAEALLAQIHPELEHVDDVYRTALASDSPHVRALVEHASLFRGKRLRPALVLFAGKAVGGLTAAHVDIGAVVEMIHTATLLHDDVLDHATTRRNVPSVNALHGNEIPILLGDFIFAQAFALASSLEDRTASRLLSQTTRRLCSGEIDQNCSRGRFDLTVDEYLKIIEDKTASLYAASARLGGWYSGAPHAQCAALEEYGRLVGLAFQIVDDCLDLAGDERRVGKSLGSDLSERKMTLPLLRLFERVGPARSAELQRLLADPATDDPRAALRSAVDLAPDLASARKTAEEFVTAALAQLKPLPLSPSKDALLALGDFILERDR